MVSLAGSIYFQNQSVSLLLARLQGCTSHSRDFISSGNFHFELRGISLDHTNIRQCRQPKFGLAYRYQRFDVGEEADFSWDNGSNRLPRGPPRSDRLPRGQRGLDGCVTVFGCAIGDQPRTDVHTRVLTGNDEGHLPPPCRWHGENE